MSEEKIKKMDIKEFHEKGFLLEVNRQFFHPLGLALEITVEDDGTGSISGVWDYRDDPEGMAYGNGDKEKKASNNEKAKYVEELRLSKVEARRKMTDVLIDDRGIQIFRHYEHVK